MKTLCGFRTIDHNSVHPSIFIPIELVFHYLGLIYYLVYSSEHKIAAKNIKNKNNYVFLSNSHLFFPLLLLLRLFLLGFYLLNLLIFGVYAKSKQQRKRWWQTEKFFFRLYADESQILALNSNSLKYLKMQCKLAAHFMQANLRCKISSNFAHTKRASERDRDKETEK